jgi:hypothetical protein
MKKVLALALTLIAASAGCSGRPSSGTEKRDFKAVVRAHSDDERPLAGVVISAAGRRLGATDAAGNVTVRVPGDEGQSIPVSITCPEGFIAPQAPAPLRLTSARALATGKTEPLVYETTCDRKERNVVVAVRASGSSGLPILINGQRHAVTDENGIAHVALTVDRDAPSLRVDLDTAAAPSLMPQNPGRTFALKGKDSILIFDQTFSHRMRRRPKAASAPPRHVPQRLN